MSDQSLPAAVASPQPCEVLEAALKLRALMRTPPWMMIWRSRPEVFVLMETVVDYAIVSQGKRLRDDARRKEE